MRWPLALEPLVAAPDPAASNRSPERASPPRRATPVAAHRPIDPAGSGRARRGLGPIRSIVALGVVTLVVGGLAMVVLGADAGGAGAEVSPRPTRTARATAKPTAEAVKATATPEAVAAATDVCRPILDVPCSLGAGRYAPAGLSPAVDFTLGKGWSTELAVDDLLVLSRDEGLLTLASRVKPPAGVGPTRSVPARPRRSSRPFAATDGVKSTKPASVTIDGHKGRSVDVTPTGSARRAVFRAGGRTLYVEPKPDHAAGRARQRRRPDRPRDRARRRAYAATDPRHGGRRREHDRLPLTVGCGTSGAVRWSYRTIDAGTSGAHASARGSTVGLPATSARASPVR